MLLHINGCYSNTLSVNLSTASDREITVSFTELNASYCSADTRHPTLAYGAVQANFMICA